ncbi:hypothetical protein FSP39_000774 [Pinctada imbricata]|uniref:Reverse transcriptase domain-containing protein n=1 Tax=Pinctada imbricata TaxID=66713 RepID=A0AA88XP67_PINIB|nr:hypothetical protein FSP39_000774 [Pinctada imbricata]
MTTTTNLADVQGETANSHTFANTAEVHIRKETVTLINRNNSQQTQTHSKQQPHSLEQKSQQQLRNNFQIKTPIKAEKLQFWLRGYKDSYKEYLTNGFKFGFKIPFIGSRSFRVHKNLNSARGNPKVLNEIINSEISKGRAEGPFEFPPFPHLQCSPLGLVPKKEPGIFRLIHHLSYPEGASVNDGIPQQFCTVKYQSIEDAVVLLKQIGKGALMAKTDIAEAFKNVPIHPSDFELLGFSFQNKFYFDKTLPFGLSFSCNLFERFSKALHWVMENYFQTAGCVHVLDDFLFMGPPSTNKCSKALFGFISLCNDIGVPIKHEKTVEPVTRITFLGIEIDSVKFELRLPQDKITKITDSLKRVQNKRKVTLQELQSLIGLLNFACSVVIPGRTFLRRLIDLTRGIQKPHHFRRLNSEARADIQAWLIFIKHFNGKALILEDKWYTSSHLNLHTDASNIGFGGTFQTQWFYGSWNYEWTDLHITVKELFPIVLALELYSHIIENNCIEFFSDNMAVVHIINKQTSKDPVIMKLVRRLVITALKHNILFKATHIPGTTNIASDKLARLQIKEFRDRFPQMNQLPTNISTEMLKI